jgi:hypothetical protein
MIADPAGASAACGPKSAAPPTYLATTATASLTSALLMATYTQPRSARQLAARITLRSAAFVGVPKRTTSCRRRGFRWGQALAQANASTHAGFNDWRLPNRAELRSLVETGCADPAINTVVFPATATTEYWSSTTYTLPPGGLTVDFRLGAIFYQSKTAVLQVRLVRGGQRFDSFSAEADSVPDSFSLNAQTGVPIGSQRTSDPITVAGLTTVTGIGVSGAAGSSYSINGGAFSTQPGAVVNSDVVRVRHTSATTLGMQTTTTLFIGGVTADFVSTTLSDTVFSNGFE